MTAVAGFWGFSGEARSVEHCRRMLDAQQVYAPDPPVIWSDSGVALGRRLFRLLPEDCHDRGSAVGVDGRWCVAADLRLDNRDELADRLSLFSGEAAQLSDTALLLKCLECWGEDAIDRLIGDFAFAAWESRERRLLLARDFLGRRPLHYHRGNGFFAVASMPKGLHALPQVPRRPDEDMLSRFLALMPESGSQSFFEGVERVEPGHFVVVTASGVRTQRYWEPRPEPLRLRDPEAYADAVREQLDRAVAARLRGAAPVVASQLSGGLDSSAVSATAARLAAPDGQVVAFTSVPREGYTGKIPRGRFGDEGPHAASVAALYPNMEHVLVRTEGRSPLAALDRNFYLYERPVLNLCNSVWSDAIFAEAKARRLSVMLIATMGNLSFSYPGLSRLPELLASGRWLQLTRELRHLSRSGMRLDSIAAHTIGPLLPPILWRGVNRLRGRHLGIEDYSSLRSDLAATLRDRAAGEDVDFSYRPRRNPVADRLWMLRRVDPGNYLKGWLGGWGVDARDPAADRRLIELCLSIPTDQFLRNGQARALARLAFADRLPAPVVNEQRKGLQAVDWHEGLSAARDDAREELDRFASVPAAGAIDAARLRPLFEEWPRDGEWNVGGRQSRYRLALLRGLSSGHFARKASGSNE